MGQGPQDPITSQGLHLSVPLRWGEVSSTPTWEATCKPQQGLSPQTAVKANIQGIYSACANSHEPLS